MSFNFSLHSKIQIQDANKTEKVLTLASLIIGAFESMLMIEERTHRKGFSQEVSTDSSEHTKRSYLLFYRRFIRNYGKRYSQCSTKYYMIIILK